LDSLPAKKITGRPAIQWAAVVVARNFDGRISFCVKIKEAAKRCFGA